MSIASLFRSVGHGVKVAVKFIATGFIRMFGNEAAKRFVQDSYSLLQSAIGRIVLEVVQELSATQFENGAKREAAVNKVLAVAREQAITVAESEVRLLVELAVQFVKGNFQVQASG
jgi:hypothetical protein